MNASSLMHPFERLNPTHSAEKPGAALTRRSQTLKLGALLEHLHAFLEARANSARHWSGYRPKSHCRMATQVRPCALVSTPGQLDHL